MKSFIFFISVGTYVFKFGDIIQGDKKVSAHLLITIKVFLVSLLGSILLLGSQPPGPGGH
jgi:hypothetical protein